MIESLHIKQQQIIERAANLVRAPRRQEFIKYTEDVLRAKPQPPSNSDVRHACCASLLRYRRPS